MAKVQIKTEKLTPLGRIFLIMELLIKRLPSLFNALEISDFIVAKNKVQTWMPWIKVQQFYQI